MKVLLPIIVFIIIILSCEKVDEDYCWTCTTYYYERIYYQDGEILEKRYPDSLDLCGYSDKDIQKYEQYHTMEPYSISTCGNYVRWQDCLCIKKEEK